MAVACGPAFWVSDDERDRCLSCTAAFGLFLRRHHCRRCGEIFCDPCSSATATLNSLDGRDLGPQRVCAACLEQLTHAAAPRRQTSSNDTDRPRRSKSGKSKKKSKRRDSRAEEWVGDSAAAAAAAGPRYEPEPEPGPEPEPELDPEAEPNEDPQAENAGMRRIAITGHMTVPGDAQRLAAVRAAMEQHAELSRAEDGCLKFEVTPTDTPGRFQVSELYSNRAALERHKHRTAASPWPAMAAGIERDYSVRELDDQPDDLKALEYHTSAGGGGEGAAALPARTGLDIEVMADGSVRRLESAPKASPKSGGVRAIRLSPEHRLLLELVRQVGAVGFHNVMQVAYLSEHSSSSLDLGASVALLGELEAMLGGLDTEQQPLALRGITMLLRRALALERPSLDLDT